jgi:hypothetical protein
MKLISYMASLPASQFRPLRTDSHKVRTLMYFAEGAAAAGDDATVSYTLEYQPCDVAVILGYVHEHGKQAPHLSFRRHILDQQRQRGGRTVVVDSNLFLYHNTANPLDIYRYGFDGVFPGQAEYCDQRKTDRWSVLSAMTGTCPKPWRQQGTHILLCLQRDGGWSMMGHNVADWAIDTVTQLRQITQRPIRLRPHPGDRAASVYVKEVIKKLARHGVGNVAASAVESSLLDDLRDCWAVVNHNSSPAVAAAIEGIPVFATDPELSQAREVANRDLNQIENPIMPDRNAWLERLSQFHWSLGEVRGGYCWRHMRQWVKAPV